MISLEELHAAFVEGWLDCTFPTGGELRDFMQEALGKGSQRRAVLAGLEAALDRLGDEAPDPWSREYLCNVAPWDPQ